jgi:hypothetical protein
MLALAAPELHDRFEEADWLSVTLPRAADDCHALFCDLERIPEWLSIVRSAVVTDRSPGERPKSVAFLCSLHRATVGYTLDYTYQDRDRRVAWTTPRRSSLRVRGFAHFQPLGPRACLMTYSLDLAFGRTMPRFDDAAFAAHATSATLNDFRDFVLRELH